MDLRFEKAALVYMRSRPQGSEPPDPKMSKLTDGVWALRSASGARLAEVSATGQVLWVGPSDDPAQAAVRLDGE